MISESGNPTKQTIHATRYYYGTTKAMEVWKCRRSPHEGMRKLRTPSVSYNLVVSTATLLGEEEPPCRLCCCLEPYMSRFPPKQDNIQKWLFVRSMMMLLLMMGPIRNTFCTSQEEGKRTTPHTTLQHPMGRCWLSELFLVDSECKDSEGWCEMVRSDWLNRHAVAVFAVCAKVRNYKQKRAKKFRRKQISTKRACTSNLSPQCLNFELWGTPKRQRHSMHKSKCGMITQSLLTSSFFWGEVSFVHCENTFYASRNCSNLPKASAECELPYW